MRHIVGATYRNGTLELDRALDLHEGERVRVFITGGLEDDLEDARALANEIYNDLSDLDIKEIDQIALTSHGHQDSGSIDRAE